MAIIVTVGTDHHPFDRLVNWVDQWANDHPEVDVLVQRGRSDAPRHARSEAFMDPGSLAEAMADADAVVCHGGPSSIMEARAAGHRPIVVPRDPALGEHVDGHQLRFAAALEGEGLIDRPTTPAGLHALLDRSLVEPTRLAADDRATGAETVARIGNLIDDLVEGARAPTARDRSVA